MDGRISASHIWGYNLPMRGIPVEVLKGKEKQKASCTVYHCCIELKALAHSTCEDLRGDFFFLDMLYIIDAWGSQMHYCNVLIFLYLQISCKQIAVFPDLFSNLSCLQSEKVKVSFILVSQEGRNRPLPLHSLLWPHCPFSWISLNIFWGIHVNHSLRRWIVSY